MPLLLNMVRRHWPAIVAFVVMLALVCGAYLHGITTGNTRAVAHYEALLAERDRQAAEQRDQALAEAKAQAAQAMAAERAHLQAQAKTEARFKTITRTVTEYVEKTPALAECGLDADGLRYWNAANGGGTDPDAEAGSP